MSEEQVGGQSAESTGMPSASVAYLHSRVTNWLLCKAGCWTRRTRLSLQDSCCSLMLYDLKTVCGTYSKFSKLK